MTQKRRGFLTPNVPPEERLCRSFSIPNDTVWLGTFIGALEALTSEAAWEKYGTLTPEEAAEAYREIIADALPGLIGECCTPSLPGGGKIIRITIDGHFEELADNGEWVEPTGDYEIPPVTPREGGTPADQKCLAAANAANVLEDLYEQVTDMIGEGLSIIEMIGGIIIAISALIANAIGAAAGAIITIVSIAFREFIEAAIFLGADV